EKRGVRPLAPQEERKSRCEFQVADLVYRSGRRVRGRRLGAIEKFGAGQNGHQAGLNSRLEITCGSAVLEERERRCQVAIGYRPAECETRDVREDLRRAGQFVRV